MSKLPRRKKQNPENTEKQSAKWRRSPPNLFLSLSLFLILSFFFIAALAVSPPPFASQRSNFVLATAEDLFRPAKYDWRTRRENSVKNKKKPGNSTFQLVTSDHVAIEKKKQRKKNPRKSYRNRVPSKRTPTPPNVNRYPTQSIFTWVHCQLRPVAVFWACNDQQQQQKWAKRRF